VDDDVAGSALSVRHPKDFANANNQAVLPALPTAAAGLRRARLLHLQQALGLVRSELVETHDGAFVLRGKVRRVGAHFQRRPRGTEPERRALQQLLVHLLREPPRQHVVAQLVEGRDVADGHAHQVMPDLVARVQRRDWSVAWS